MALTHFSANNDTKCGKDRTWSESNHPAKHTNLRASLLGDSGTYNKRDIEESFPTGGSGGHDNTFMYGDFYDDTFFDQEAGRHSY